MKYFAIVWLVVVMAVAQDPQDPQAPQDPEDPQDTLDFQNLDELQFGQDFEDTDDSQDIRGGPVETTTYTTTRTTTQTTTRTTTVPSVCRGSQAWCTNSRQCCSNYCRDGHCVRWGIVEDDRNLDHPCSYTTCPVNTTCIIQQVQCGSVPCPGIARCV